MHHTRFSVGPLLPVIHIKSLDVSVGDMLSWLVDHPKVGGIMESNGCLRLQYNIFRTDGKLDKR